MAPIEDHEQRLKIIQIGEVFTPSAPIDDEDLFAGRNHELMSVIEASQSAGQHCVIFGERGIGKTSLARITSAIASAQGQVAVRINCDAGDEFDQLWFKVAEELQIVLGEMPNERRHALNGGITNCIDGLRTGDLNPGSVRIALRQVSTQLPLLIFFDEFNELADSNAIILMSNTIKTLSDNIERVTLCPVGVAESLDALLEGHLSAIRAIVQVKMPRMNRSELSQIVTRGLDKLGMSCSNEALDLIRVIPRGLPQYAHLLAQEGARNALLRSELEITREDVLNGLDVGLKKLDRSLSHAYVDATYSPKKNNRFKEVLLACAIAKLGDMGDFSPSDIREPYSRIIGEAVTMDRYNPQLTSLATNRDILVREGEERRWRYRFRDPLMEPYVIMEGLREGRINLEDFPH